MDNVLKEYIKEIYSDTRFFAEQFLPHILTSKIPAFHGEIYNLTRTEKRLVVAAPRGFAKSTIVSVVYPIWLGLTGFYKDIVILSASQNLAIEQLRKVKREFEINEKLRKYFGDLITDKWSETHIILKTGVSIRALGYEGQIRGFRPDCIIIDDLETDESVESEDRRKKLRDWVFKACLNTLTVDGQLIIIGTIIHHLSFLKELLTSSVPWTKRLYKAWKSDEMVAGTELWPEYWPHERLLQRKAEIGSRAFSAEFLNDPLLDESAPILPHQIRYWTDLPRQYSLAIAVDPAYSSDATSAYKVASLVATDEQMNRYLVSYIRTHEPIGEFIDAVLNLWLQNKDKVTAIGIPNSGVEKSFFDSFLRRAADRKLYPPVTEVTNSFTTNSGRTFTSKVPRITAALQPLFENGKYYIHESHVDAKDELLTFSNGDYKDIVDSLFYAEQLVQPGFVEDTTILGDNYEPINRTKMTNYGWAM